MNDMIEVPTPRQRSLKTIGHSATCCTRSSRSARCCRACRRASLLLLVAFVLDLFKRDDAARHLAGVALSLAHPQRALGRRPVPRHGAAVAAARSARLDRLGADLALVPLPHRARLAALVERTADAVPERLTP